METRRWLLPFTFGVDMQALDMALSLAESGGVTLVAVSLILEAGRKGPRLEVIQQSKDFLEAVKWQAKRRKVEIERYEVFTLDTLTSLEELPAELHCQSLLLMIRGAQGLLLSPREFSYVFTHLPVPLMCIRLPASATQRFLHHLREGFFSWWCRWLPQPQNEPLLEDRPTGSESAAPEASLESMKEHSLG